MMIACLILAMALADGSALAQQSSAAAPRNTQPVHSSSIAGEWAGTLQAGETQLHLVLHLSKDAQGAWQAKLDSLDQAVFGMEASRISQSQDTLSFELDSVGGKYHGTLLPDHKTIRGIWEQGSTALPLKFEKRVAGSEARLAANAISRAEGTWQGAIETGNMRMRLQLHIAHDEKGQLIASCLRR